MTIEPITDEELANLRVWLGRFPETSATTAVQLKSLIARIDLERNRADEAESRIGRLVDEMGGQDDHIAVLETVVGSAREWRNQSGPARFMGKSAQRLVEMLDGLDKLEEDLRP